MGASGSRGWGYWALVVFAAVIALIGLLLAAGGLWLIVLGGSWYYLPAGLGLLVSGILMWRSKPSGIWLYWLVLIATAIWAVWEVGLDWWALMPRVLALAVLGIVALLFIPVVRRYHHQP